MEMIDEKRADDLLRLIAEHVDDVRADVEDAAADRALEDDVERVLDEIPEAVLGVRLRARSALYGHRHRPPPVLQMARRSTSARSRHSSRLRCDALAISRPNARLTDRA